MKPSARPLQRVSTPLVKGLARGFTLLEILVTLAVLALSMTAVSQSISGSILAFQRIKEATFAQWVAMNLVAEYQLKPVFPSPGNENGSEELAGKEWFWKSKIEKTEDPDMLRMQVEVRANKKDESTEAKLNAFIARPRLTANVTPVGGPSGGGKGGGDDKKDDGIDGTESTDESGNDISGGGAFTDSPDQFSSDPDQFSSDLEQ